ncbi:hypothetical protein ElyMa_002990000 [Elysia marginata]|uniref:Uncharacterized protein n=1 Tax=Elysia marginata TaxID=1093978 RepID=A0AAV4IBM1_9GAST|nr:hypothetical protein ElyMa_002990000 [Elysia marginata]
MQFPHPRCSLDAGSQNLARRATRPCVDGELKSTTQRQRRNLVRNHMNNRFLSASASLRQRGRNNQRISANIVRRRLSTSGLRARRPCPILTQRHRHQRKL